MFFGFAAMDLWKRMRQNKSITTHDPCFSKNIELSSTDVPTQHRQTTLPSPGLKYFQCPINKSSCQCFGIKWWVWKSVNFGLAGPPWPSRMFSSLLAGPSFLYDHPECFLFPHITVWGSCFSLGTRRCFRIPPRRLTPQSHHAITLITAQLITSLHHTNLSPHSLSPYFSHPTHTTSSHQLITTQPLTLILTSDSSQQSDIITPHTLTHHSTERLTTARLK